MNRSAASGLVLLAAAPSSLMLGVTAHLTTDVASAPFLWVIPLALYLLTFVIAFQTRPAASPAIGLGLQAAAAAACAALIAFRTGEWLLPTPQNHCQSPQLKGPRHLSFVLYAQLR